jgi:dethiobiotin synthetase
MPYGVFITGTDTGVGKTTVACAMLHAFAAAGNTAVGMKPVAAGLENGRLADVEALARAGTVQAPRNFVNPYAFEPAIAPHLAAKAAGVEIDVEVIADAYGKLSRLAQVVVVEGAGGFLVPVNERQTMADAAERLGLPVVLVVGMRLGCLNHALLTRGAIEARRLHCAGWVANCITPDTRCLDENIRALEQRLACPLLGVVPFHRNPQPSDVARLLTLPSVTEFAA